jgi:hypothetical protein
VLLGFGTALTKLVSGSPNMLWEHMKLIVSSIRAMRMVMADLSIRLFFSGQFLIIEVKYCSNLFI